MQLEFNVHTMYVSKCAFCLVFTWWHVCINYAYFCYIHRIIIWCHDIVSSHNINHIVYITNAMQWHSVMTWYNDSMNITKISIVNANTSPCEHQAKCTFWYIHGMDIKLQLQSNFSSMISSQHLFSPRRYGQFQKTADFQ